MIDIAVRSRGIGGSEVAAILGLDSRRDAYSVYVDKLGLVKRSEPSGRMKWGKRIEQAIAEAYAEETHQQVEWCDETMTHVDREWQVYTPDAFVLRPGGYGPGFQRYAGGLDAKNVSWDQADKWDQGEGMDAVPLPIGLQCLWYCSASELPWWDVGALFGGNDLRTFRIHRCPEIEESILEEADRFWRHNVLARVPPQPGPSPATVEALKQMYPRNVQKLRFASTEETALMAELKAANEEWDGVNNRCLTAENQLKAAIGDSEGLLAVNGWKLTWRREKDSEGPDWEAVARELALRIGLLGNRLADGMPLEWCETVEDIAKRMKRVTRHGARKLHASWGKKKF